jgi:hypothetical protein
MRNLSKGKFRICHFIQNLPKIHGYISLFDRFIHILSFFIYQQSIVFVSNF